MTNTVKPYQIFYAKTNYYVSDFNFILFFNFCSKPTRYEWLVYWYRKFYWLFSKWINSGEYP